jgi:hypothetical protein
MAGCCRGRYDAPDDHARWQEDGRLPDFVEIYIGWDLHQNVAYEENTDTCLDRRQWQPISVRVGTRSSMGSLPHTRCPGDSNPLQELPIEPLQYCYGPGSS